MKRFAPASSKALERLCFAGVLIAAIAALMVMFGPIPHPLESEIQSEHSEAGMWRFVGGAVALSFGGLLFAGFVVARFYRRRTEVSELRRKAEQMAATLIREAGPDFRTIGALPAEPAPIAIGASAAGAYDGHRRGATRLAGLALVPAPIVWLLDRCGIGSPFLSIAIPAALVLAIVALIRAKDRATRRLATAGVVLNSVVILLVIAGGALAIWLQGTVRAK